MYSERPIHRDLRRGPSEIRSLRLPSRKRISRIVAVEVAMGRDWINADRVERLGKKDESTWREFLFEYYDVFRHALIVAFVKHVGSFPPPGEDAEDLTVQAMQYFKEKFPENFQEYKGDEAFRSYLFDSARYFALEYRKAQQKERGRNPVSGRLEEGEEPIAHSVDEKQQEQLDALNQCLARLPQKCRAVVNLYFHSKKKVTMEFLAKEFELEVAELRRLYRQALKLLRECMEKKLGGKIAW